MSPPTASTGSEMEEFLKGRLATSGVEGAAIATRDGLAATPALPPSVEPESLCAMAAAGLAAIETAWLHGGFGSITSMRLRGAPAGLIHPLDDRFLLILIGGESEAQDAFASEVQEAWAAGRR